MEDNVALLQSDTQRIRSLRKRRSDVTTRKPLTSAAFAKSLRENEAVKETLKLNLQYQDIIRSRLDEVNYSLIANMKQQQRVKEFLDMVQVAESQLRFMSFFDKFDFKDRISFDRPVDPSLAVYEELFADSSDKVNEYLSLLTNDFAEKMAGAVPCSSQLNHVVTGLSKAVKVLASAKESSPKVKGSSKAKCQSLAQAAKRLLTPESSNVAIDWRVALTQLNVRSELTHHELEHLWIQYASPEINKSSFSKAETAKLKEIALRHNERNWNKIAAGCKSKRSPFILLQHYTRKIQNDKGCCLSEDELEFLFGYLSWCASRNGTFVAPSVTGYDFATVSRPEKMRISDIRLGFSAFPCLQLLYDNGFCIRQCEFKTRPHTRRRLLYFASSDMTDLFSSTEDTAIWRYFTEKGGDIENFSISTFVQVDAMPPVMLRVLCRYWQLFSFREQALAIVKHHGATLHAVANASLTIAQTKSIIKELQLEKLELLENNSLSSEPWIDVWCPRSDIQKVEAYRKNFMYLAVIHVLTKSDSGAARDLARFVLQLGSSPCGTGTVPKNILPTSLCKESCFDLGKDSQSQAKQMALFCSFAVVPSSDATFKVLSNSKAVSNSSRVLKVDVDRVNESGLDEAEERALLIDGIVQAHLSAHPKRLHSTFFGETSPTFDPDFPVIRRNDVTSTGNPSKLNYCQLSKVSPGRDAAVATLSTALLNQLFPDKKDAVFKLDSKQVKSSRTRHILSLMQQLQGDEPNLQAFIGDATSAFGKVSYCGGSEKAKPSAPCISTLSPDTLFLPPCEGNMNFFQTFQRMMMTLIRMSPSFTVQDLSTNDELVGDVAVAHAEARRLALCVTTDEFRGFFSMFASVFYWPLVATLVKNPEVIRQRGLVAMPQFSGNNTNDETMNQHFDVALTWLQKGAGWSNLQRDARRRRGWPIPSSLRQPVPGDDNWSPTRTA